METKNGLFIKDLRILRNRSLSKIIMIDNLVHSFAFQINNGYPILEFRGNKEDKELLFLMDFLKELLQVQSVPDFLKESLALARRNNWSKGGSFPRSASFDKNPSKPINPPKKQKKEKKDKKEKKVVFLE